MTHDAYKQISDTHHIPSYARFDVVLDSGKGAVAVDVNGKEYIDFGAGIGVNSLGYCDDGWVKAVSEQAARIQHCSNLYYNTQQTLLAQELCEMSGWAGVFFANSGAEANECAIKLARKYSFDHYGPGRDEILTLENSFHGRTVTTLSATGQDAFHQYFYPFTGGFAYAQAGEEFLSRMGDQTCAVILEAVQGEGGVIPLEQEFVQSVAEECRKRDILLIFDEVQTGIGRTGKLLGYEHFGVQPDVVTLAKGLGGGLPIGACLCAEKYVNVLSAGQHGSTFGGNPVVCAGARYVLATVGKQDFLDEVMRKGQYLKKELSGYAHVKSVRGLGMMLGAELDGIEAKTVAVKCAEKGLLVLTAKTALRLLPPLNINEEELARGLKILKSVLEEEV